MNELPVICTDPNALEQLRMFLFGGLVAAAVGFAILNSLDPRGAKATPAMASKIKRPGEECKLHARKLDECTRLGYHAADEEPKEGDDDDSSR